MTAEDITSMSNALSYQGVEEPSIRVFDSLALGCQTMRMTPESFYEENPLYDSESRLYLNATVRLDNRDELCRDFDIPSIEWATLPDNRLILMAFQRWGEACPTHLVGDFAFVIWDAYRKQLFCATDHFGVRRLYYTYSSGRFVFATAIQGILALPGFSARLNRRHAALYPFLVNRYEEDGSTFFEGIFTLLKATTLTLDNQVLKKQSYWTPAPSPELHYKSDDQWLEAFRDVFFKSVEARLRSAFPVVALLSGGLDSSAIVAAAAHILKNKNKSLRVLSAVLTDEVAGKERDERDYIAQFSDWDNVDIEYVTDEHSGPLDGGMKLIEHAGFPKIQPTHYLVSAFGESARRHGARCILDGTGGESGPTYYATDYLAEMLVKGRWLKCLYEMRQYKARYQVPWWTIIRWRLINALVPVPIRLMRNRTSLFNLQEMLDQFPIKQSFMEQIDGDERSGILKHIRAINEKRPNHRKNQLGYMKHARAPFYDIYTDHVSFAYPYYDKRLMEFCLAVPGHLKFHDGFSRYLIRSGMDGYLPPKIQWRTTNAPFSTDYHLRYNKQRPQMIELLGDINPSDPVREIVDVDRLVKAVKHDMTESSGMSSQNFASLHIVPLGIYMIYFLRQFDEFKTH